MLYKNFSRAIFMKGLFVNMESTRFMCCQKALSDIPAFSRFSGIQNTLTVANRDMTGPTPPTPGNVGTGGQRNMLASVYISGVITRVVDGQTLR